MIWLNRTKMLGDFLKKKRESLNPREFGIIPSARRRVIGLKRDEVASFSNISLSWYTSLEQGRNINVSKDILLIICNTLKLNEVEITYVLKLINDNSLNLKPISKSKLDHLKQIVDSYPHPAFVKDERFYIIYSNSLYKSIFSNLYKSYKGTIVNLIELYFKEPYMKTLMDDWDEQAKIIVEAFRYNTTAYIEKEWYNEFIVNLINESKEFSSLWNSHQISNNILSNKIINHPALGSLSFNSTILSIPDCSNTKVVFFIPNSDTDTQKKLDTLTKTL